MEDILTHYWYPLYAWARRRGMTEEDAADSVQGFMEKACATNLIAAAREERGRLRSWLLKCLTRYVSEARDRKLAQKRGGGTVGLIIEWQRPETIYLAEPSLTESPEVLYSRAWAVSLMEEALLQLTAHYEKDGRGALCQALLPALESPLRDSTFAEEAVGLRMTAGALRSAAARMRQRYRKILLELATARLGITCEAALAEELRALLTGT